MSWPKRLSDEEKERIFDMDDEGYTVAEIAKALGRSRSVVRKMLRPDNGVENGYDKSLWDVLGRGLK